MSEFDRGFPGPTHSISHGTAPYRSIQSQPLDVEDETYVAREADDCLWQVVSDGGIAWIQAPRRVGKTSLLLHCERRAQESPEIVFVSLDLQGLLPGGQSPTRLFEDLWEALIEALPPHARPTARTLPAQEEQHLGLSHKGEQSNSAIFDMDRTGDPSPLTPVRERRRPVAWFVAQCEQLIDSLSPRRLVVALDEIERCGPTGLPLVLDAVRLLFSHRGPARQWRSSVVLVGSASPAALCAGRDEGSPFNLGLRIALRTLREDEVVRLLAVVGLPGVSHERAARRILHWTGGSAFLTNAFARVVSQRSGGGAGDATREVDRLAETILSADPNSEPEAGTIYENALGPLVARVARLAEAEFAPGVGWLLREARANAARRWSTLDRLFPRPAPPVDQHQRARDELLVAGVLPEETGRPARFSCELYRRVFSRAWIERYFPEATPPLSQRLVQGAIRHARTVALATLLIITLVSLALMARQQAMVEREQALRTTIARSTLGGFRLLQRALNDTPLLDSPSRIELLSQAWREFEAFPAAEITEPALLSSAAQALQEFNLAIGDTSQSGLRTAAGTLVPDAIAVARREVQVTARLVELQAADPRWKPLHAAALQRLSRVQSERGDPRGAVATALESLAFTQAWWVNAPHDPTARLANFSSAVEWASARYTQATHGELDVHERRSLLAETLQALNDLEPLEQTLDPEDRPSRLVMARRHQMLAITLHKHSNQGRHHVWNEAGRVQQLLADWPQPSGADFTRLGDWLQAQQILARALNAQGLSLVQAAGESATDAAELMSRAIHTHESALKIRQGVHDRCPWMWSARRDVAQSLGNLAEAYALRQDAAGEIRYRRQVWDLLSADISHRQQLTSLVNLWRLQGLRLADRLIDEGRRDEAANLFAEIVGRVPSPIEDCERNNPVVLIQVVRAYNLLSQYPGLFSRAKLPVDPDFFRSKCHDLCGGLADRGDLGMRSLTLWSKVLDELMEGVFRDDSRGRALREWLRQRLATFDSRNNQRPLSAAPPQSGR
jgi:hypothetical protein